MPAPQWQFDIQGDTVHVRNARGECIEDVTLFVYSLIRQQAFAEARAAVERSVPQE